MSVPDVITTARVKSYLGLPAALTQHDTFLDYLIDASTEAVAVRLGLTAGLTVNTYSEVLDVEDEGTDQLRLSAYPLVSVVALTNDGSLVEASAYYVHRSKRWVRLVDDLGSFTRGRQKVSVTYTAGWATVPEPVLHAITANVAHHFNRLPKTGVDSERIGAYSISLAKGEASALCLEAEAMMAEHFSPVVAR